MTLKPDTGAEVAAITEPGMYPHKAPAKTLHVVRDLEQNLLGLPVIEELNLLAKVAEDKVNTIVSMKIYESHLS